MVVAHKANIPIFVTGGIGGVHRGANKTMDISADLTELGRTPVTVVSAGVKSILDIGLTLEYLETQGVCVATLGPTRDFPAFFSPKSGFLSPHNVNTIDEAAQLVNKSMDLGLESGILLAVPIPENEASTGAVIDSAIKTAVEEAEKAGISGREVTPFILARVNELTAGDSLKANLALIHNNAKHGADLAVHLANLRSGGTGGNFTKVAKENRPVVIGGSNFDFVARVTEGDICFDGSTHKGKLQYSHGGVGRNIASALAYLDACPTFLSAVGEDKPGKSILFGNSCLDTSSVMIHPTAATATYTAIIDSKGECKFGIGDMAVHDQVSPQYIQSMEDKIKTSPLVVVDGNIPQQTIDVLFRLCQSHSVPLFYEPTDCGVKSLKPFLTGAAGAMTYCSPNMTELCDMATTILKQSCQLDLEYLQELKRTDLNKLLNILTDICVKLMEHHGLSVIMVTLSARGVLLVRKGDPDDPLPLSPVSSIASSDISAVHYPGTPADVVVSVSGAGDCLNAGFIAALLRGEDQHTCVNVGMQGVGGTAAAYFLSQSLPGAQIHVFEEEKVGGRLATVQTAGREYEVGGSVIHPANKYMQDFLTICHMKKAKMSNQISGNLFSMHSNGQIIFQESSIGLWFKIQMIWRYGLWSLLKFDRLIGNMLANFAQIYPQLKEGSSYPTVKDLLLAMGPISKKGKRSTEMLDMASVPLNKKLEEVGVSEQLINELVRVATRVNYGQMPDKIDAFVGSVALAGAQGGLWAVEGGNYRIPEHLLHLSKAKHHKMKIEEIHKLKNGKYFLNISRNHEGETKKQPLNTAEFDMVIVAAPQTSDKPRVKFFGLEKEPKFPGKYHLTVATIVHGFPNPRTLGFKDNTTMTKVNFFLSPDNILASMARLTPVNFDPKVDKEVPSVWKIFSSRILTEEELDNLFVERMETMVRDWLAYPEYITKKDPHECRFVLGPGLYYLSDIEWAASAMEMSSIAAKNVVNLARDYWNGQVGLETKEFKDLNNNVKIEL